MRLWLPVAAAAAALAAGGFFVSRSSVFNARGIDVLGAAHRSRAEVVAAAEVSRQTNVLWFDEASIEARLEADPWIAAADVGVSLPWTIEITVVERTPVAIATGDVGAILVAADGTELGLASRPRGLPRIRLPIGPTFEGLHASPGPAARAIGAMAPGLRDRVASVTVAADGTLRIRLRGGVAIWYGSASELRRKAAALDQILAWAEEEGERLASVNVVAPGLPAVKLVG